MYNAPLFPLVDTPELNITIPLTPEEPESALFKVNPPLEAVVDPDPLDKYIRPPTPPVVLPD
jgi:hypothetical protein